MYVLQGTVSVIGNTLLALIIILLLRDAMRILAARLAVIALIGSIGFSLSLLPESLSLPKIVHQSAVFVNAISFGFQWLLGRALMQDRFRVHNLDWFLVVVMGLIVLAADSPVFGVTLSGRATFQLLALAAVTCVLCHLSWIAISSFDDDLLANRRRVRIWFTVFIVFSYMVLLSMDLLRAPTFAKAIFYDSCSIVISIAIVLWATHFNSEKLFSQAVNDLNIAKKNADAKDNQQLNRLLNLMEHDQLYRQPDLSIRTLAEHLGLAEHNLRPLINKHLGYRNFAAFLNNYRLQHARALLSDSSMQNTAILNIAMDAGYQTLSTFNRAFKSHYQETPSAFRARSLLTERDQ